MNKTLHFFCVFFICFSCSHLSFSQAYRITLKGQWNQAGTDYNDVWGYVDDSGKEYAILGSTSKVHFFNVSTPTSPTLIAEFAPGSTTTWRDIKTYEHYAYAVSDGSTNEGLLIFDLCEIASGTVEKAYQNNSVFAKAHNIFIDVKNARLYVVGTNTQPEGIILYDLSVNPANPTVIANLRLSGGYIHDIFVKNNLAYCSHGYNGLYIYDFTNPASPVTKALLNTGGYNHSSWAFENDSLLIYAEEVPKGLPLGVMDISKTESNDLQILKTFKEPLLGPSHTNNTPHNPYMVGNYAVVSHYEDGVVIFDLSDPQNPVRSAYYDTYPSNSTYTGYEGCWGVYPYLPSGHVLASDISTGLYVLKPDFPLKSSCNNGIQDWNETGVDCGGVCELCTPCLKEICHNGLDDDRNGLVDCMDSACDCIGNNTPINLKVMLQGYYDNATNQMSSNLVGEGLLPLYQPFKLAPFFYTGREKITTLPDNVVDWVLVEARHPDQLDSVLSRKAALLLQDGQVIETDGTPNIRFGDINAGDIHLAVRHKGHLAILSANMIPIAGGTAVAYDFTDASTKATGVGQLTQVGSKFAMYAGDFDQNGIINNQDFNLWQQNSAVINQYLSWDADGNGIINNQDYNLWTINRSKVGEPILQPK